MRTEIKSNVQVTPAIREFVEEKVFEKLEKFAQHITDVVVKLNVVNDQSHEATILLQMKGQGRFNKVSAKSEDLYESIDTVSDKAIRKARQYKEKFDRQPSHKAELFPLTEVPVVNDLEDEEFEIAKVKRFNIKPMFVEEAIMQMNMLGHNFFFYFDASINTPWVVYTRKDGKYGILESEF